MAGGVERVFSSNRNQRRHNIQKKNKKSKIKKARSALLRGAVKLIFKIIIQKTPVKKALGTSGALKEIKQRENSRNFRV